MSQWTDVIVPISFAERSKLKELIDKYNESVNTNRERGIHIVRIYHPLEWGRAMRILRTILQNGEEAAVMSYCDGVMYGSGKVYRMRYRGLKEVYSKQGEEGAMGDDVASEIEYRHGIDVPSVT